MKDPEWTSLLAWTPWGTRALVPAVALWAHLPPRGVQTNLGNPLLVFKSPVLVEILSFIWLWSRLPAHFQLERYWRGPQWNIWGIPTHDLDTDWGSAEKYQEISTQWKDWLKDAREYSSSEKVLEEREGLDWKKTEEYPGLSWKMPGRSVAGNWVVLAEWLGKRLIWHFTSIRLPL